MVDYDIPTCSNCKFNDTGVRGGTRDQGKSICYQCVQFKKFEPIQGLPSPFVLLKREAE